MRSGKQVEASCCSACLEQHAQQRAGRNHAGEAGCMPRCRVRLAAARPLGSGERVQRVTPLGAEPHHEYCMGHAFVGVGGRACILAAQGERWHAASTLEEQVREGTCRHSWRRLPPRRSPWARPHLPRTRYFGLCRPDWAEHPTYKALLVSRTLSTSDLQISDLRSDRPSPPSS